MPESWRRGGIYGIRSVRVAGKQAPVPPPDGGDEGRIVLAALPDVTLCVGALGAGVGGQRNDGADLFFIRSEYGYRSQGLPLSDDDTTPGRTNVYIVI